jgi:negative regulator of flagellin synthesis FlgM
MKIDSSIKSPISPLSPNSRATETTKTPAAPATAADDASVATHLQQTGLIDSSAPPFDSQRVAEIRQAVAEGRFKINAEKIADNLIQSVRDLLAKDRPAA